MPFDEVRISEAIGYGASGGAEFANIVIRTGSGAEQVVVQWELPLRRWKIHYDNRNVAQAAELMAFFLARKGRARKFRFKAWEDYSSDVGGIATAHDLVEITATTFQLAKHYTSGSVTHTRLIYKPVADDLMDTEADQSNSTVHIFNATTEVTSGWSVDVTTGIVTFSGAPGYTPKGTFEYDVPVRFDTDKMELVQQSPLIRDWSLDIVEVREIT